MNKKEVAEMAAIKQNVIDIDKKLDNHIIEQREDFNKVFDKLDYLSGRFAGKWVEKITANGSTYPEQALEIAYELKPDAIFLLSDGVFNNSESVWNVIMRFNSQQKVPINTVGFYTNAIDLPKIAQATGGQYMHYSSGYGP